jgi:hypothetical protein
VLTNYFSFCFDECLQITPVETSEANLTNGSLDLDESLDLSETRERKTKWPIVEVAVRDDYLLSNIFSFYLYFEG